jgi:glycosyltransferase involved in cell wall biosynthesis
MTDTPFFSIILPTYNRGPLLSKSISSVLSQKFTDFELIVVDDGSTDNTREVVQSFSDPRIHYYYKENEERNFARNFGISMAKGKYVCFLDSDDYYLPNRLEKAFSVIRDTNAFFLHLGYRLEDVDGNVIQTVDNLPSEITDLLLHHNVLSADGVVVHYELLNSVKFIKSKEFLVGEDHLLWVQLHARSNLTIVNDVTAVMTEHTERSLHIIDSEKYAAGLNDMVNHLKQDPVFFQYYKSKANFFMANNFRFGALLFAIAGKKRESLNLLLKSVQISKRILFYKPFYAVVKNLL